MRCMQYCTNEERTNSVGVFEDAWAHFSFYLVMGTSSLWSNVTEEDLLRTDGLNGRKASVLLVGEQTKSDPGGLDGRPPG
jgi:hypothetical protein